MTIRTLSQAEAQWRNSVPVPAEIALPFQWEVQWNDNGIGGKDHSERFESREAAMFFVFEHNGHGFNEWVAEHLSEVIFIDDDREIRMFRRDD